MSNIDPKTVAGFGYEWASFDQAGLPAVEARDLFDQYFKVFPWHRIGSQAEGFDLGCGTGRWARLLAPRVGTLHCIDASKEALHIAERNLVNQPNCRFHVASVDQIPLADQSMDFAYSLGVLHHVPNTLEGIRSCVSKLKPGAPFLVYLYYALENRPTWFRTLWTFTNWGRHLICRLPGWLKRVLTFTIAMCVYYPMARFALLLEKAGFDPASVPLSSYRHRSFYTMRTDAFDRFSTRLEQRFTAAQIREMMRAAGLENIQLSDSPPYWCAVGIKAGGPPR